MANVKNDQLDELYIPGISKHLFDNFEKIDFCHGPVVITFFSSNEYFKKIIFLESGQLVLYTLKISGSSEVCHFPKSVTQVQKSYDGSDWTRIPTESDRNPGCGICDGSDGRILIRFR